LKVGVCAVCNNDKINLRDYHVKEKVTGEEDVDLVICGTCHDIIEQYKQALERLLNFKITTQNIKKKYGEL